MTMNTDILRTEATEMEQRADEHERAAQSLREQARRTRSLAAEVDRAVADGVAGR